MKTNMLKLAVLLAALSVLSACAAPTAEDQDKQAINIALRKAMDSAEEDRISGDDHMVWLAARNANGITYAIDRESENEYELGVIQKLKNKKYWEICYGPSSPGMSGATYCYYFDYHSYKPIADYKIK